MKYNRKEIMKRAWEIKNKTDMSFSEALKASWKLAKKENEMKAADNAEDGTVKFNIWVGYGYVRAYYTRSWVSRYQDKKKTNYISLN